MFTRQATPLLHPRPVVISLASAMRAYVCLAVFSGAVVLSEPAPTDLLCFCLIALLPLAGMQRYDRLLLWYLALLWFGLKSVRSNPPLYLSLLGVIVYFTLASHLLNGGEQARMRYTIEPIYLLFSAGMLALLVRWLAARWPARRGVSSEAGA